VHAVEPLGEALFEEFHEGAQVVHLGPETLAELFGSFGVARGDPAFEQELGSLEAQGGAGKVLEAGNEFGERGCDVGFAGDFEEEMEVVGEDAPSKDADAAEGGVLREELAELFAFRDAKDEAPVDDTRDTVVVAGGMFGRGFPAGQTHGREQSRSWDPPAIATFNERGSREAQHGRGETGRAKGV
jgi:hypothetical protein